MEVDQLPDGRPLAQLSLAEIKEQCALRNLPKNGSRKDLTDRLKLRLELEKLREEASRALAKEDVVPNIGLQDTPVGQSDIVRQYLEAQQRRLLLFGVHRPHFENTTPIQETTPSDERKRPVAQKTKGSLKQSDLLGTTPSATRDLLANADGLLDELEETTSSIKATRGRSANHKLKVDETPSRKKTRYNSSDATNSISRAPEETTPLIAKRRRIVRGSPVQADGPQTPAAPIEFSPQGTETKEVKRGRGRPRKIKENPPAVVLSSATVTAQDGLTDPKVELSAPAQAQPAVKADADKKPIMLVSEKEENRSARAKRLRSQEETPQTLQERARVPPPANSADPALSEVSLEDPIEAALLAMHGAENATKSPKRRSLPLESLDDERSRAQEIEESDSLQANMSLDGPVELAKPKTQPVDVLENGDMLPRSAAAPDPSTAESAANRERSKVAKPTRSIDAPPVAKEALKVVEHRVELFEGKESKEVFAKKSTPIPGSPRQEVKRTGGNERTVRETRKRTKVENIVQKLTQDKVEAADIAAKEASLAKRPRKENGQTDNSKVPDASPPSSGISPDDCVLRLLGAGPKLEKSDKRAHDTPKTSKEKKPVSGSPRDKKAKEAIPTLSSPTSRRSRRGLSGEGVEVKSELDADAAATNDPAESGRRDSVEAAVAALIGEPLEPVRPVEDTASKRATRKTSRDMKAADEHQQQNLHQQPPEQQQQQRQQSLPGTVSQPSTRSSRSLRSRETSTEAETVVTDRPQVSPLREEVKPEHESPVDKSSRASAQEKPEVKPTPAVEISQAIVEGPVPSKLEQVVAKCETRRTSARQNSSESKQSKIVEHIKVEQSIKLDAAIADSTAAKREQSVSGTTKALEGAASPLVDEGASTEQKVDPASSVSDLPVAKEQPADRKDDTTIVDSERENVRSLLEQTTHKSATATVASSSTESGTKPEASEKTTKNDETDEDLDALKIVENDEQPDAQQSQKSECDVGKMNESSNLKEELAKDLGEALPTKDHKSLEVAEAATENLEGKQFDEKKTVDCEVVEKAPETEPSEQFSALLEGNKDIASDIEQEVSSKPQPEPDDLWEAVFCGDQEGNPSADWPEGNNNEDPSSSYRQSDLLDDSETNISDTPGIKLPQKFQPNVESAVASILDLNDIMRPSSSLSSHGGQNDNETAVMDNVPDADSAVAGLLSEVPFDDEGDHADLCIDDEVVSEAVPQGYEETAAECSAGVFDQEPNPPAVGEALQEISTCKETPERRISEEVRSVTGDVVESVATASLLVDVTEQQQQTTASPKSTEQTSSAPLGACSPSRLPEIPPAQPPAKSPTLSVATEKPSDVKGSVNLSEESSSESDSEDSSARNKSRIKQKERATGQIPSDAKLESESSKRKTPVSQTSKASTSRKLSDDSRVGKESSSSSSSSSSGPSSSESSSSDDDDEGSRNTEPRRATPKSLAPVRDEPKSQQATKNKQPVLSLKPEKRSKQKHSTHKGESSESMKVQSEEKSSQRRGETEHQDRVKRDQLQGNQEAETERSSGPHETHAEVPRKQRDDRTEKEREGSIGDDKSVGQEEDEKRPREQKEDQEKLRREREAAEAVQKHREAEEAKKQSEAAERALKQLEKEENIRKQAEADERARKQLEEEEKAKKQLEEEENARKQLEEEERAKKQLEEEEKARKQLEEEEKARKQLEEEEKARQLQEEMEKAKKQQEEEERARKQQEEEERLKKQEEEERLKKQEEEERLKKQEEEERLRKQEEEERLKKQQEEEKMKKQREEEELKQQLEEERAKKQREIEEKLRREEEAEKLRKQEQEAEKLRKEKEEEDLRKQKAAEEERKREQEAAALRKQKEEEESRKQEEEQNLRRAQEEERAKRLKEEEEKLREQEQAEKRSQKLKEEEMRKKLEEEERLMREEEAANLRQQQALEEQRVRDEEAEKERKRKEEESQKQKDKENDGKDDRSSERLSVQESEEQAEADNAAKVGRNDQRAESRQPVDRNVPQAGVAESDAAVESEAKASCSTASPAAKASTSFDDAEKAGSHVRQPTESNQDPVASGMMVGSNSQQRKNPLVSYGFDSEDEDDDKDDGGSDDGHEVANASEAVAKDSASKGDGGNSDHEEVSGAAPRSPVERCQDAAESSADHVRVDAATAKSDDSGGVQVSSSHTTGIFTHSVASPGMVGGLKKFEVTSSSDNSAERRPEISHNRADASSGLEGESSADEVCDVDQGLAAPNDCSEAPNQAETASSSDESARSIEEGSQSRLHSQSIESASSSAEMTSSTDRSKNQNPQDGASSSSDGLNSDPAARAAPDETDQKACVASSSPTQTTDGGGSDSVAEQPSQLPSSDDACSSSDKLPKVEHDDPAADTSTSCQDLRTEVQSSSEAGSEKLHDASSSSDKKDSTDSYADSSSPQHTMTTSNDRVESRTDGEGAPSSSDQQTGTADSQIENSAEEPDSEPVRASVESSEEASSPDYSSVDASDDPTRPKCCSSSTTSAERSSAPVEEFESGRPRCESTSETNRTSRLDDDDDFEENSQPELPGACTSSHSQQHSNQHAASEQADALSNAADEDIDISSSNNNNTNNSSNSSNNNNNNNNDNNNSSSSSNANNPATSEASSAEVDAARKPLSRPVEKTSISSSDVQPSQRSADFSLDESSGMAQSSDEPRAQMLASPLQDYGAIPDGNEVSASSSSSSATGENQANPSSSGDKDSPAPTPSSSSCKPDMKLSSSSSVEDASSEAIPMGVEHTKDGEDPNAESPLVEENADSSQEDENPSSSSTAPSNRESKEPSSN